MNSNELFQIVAESFVKQAEDPVGIEDVSEGTFLTRDGLDINSLGFIRAIIQLEEQLNIELDQSVLSIAKFKTIGDVVKLVEQYVA